MQGFWLNINKLNCNNVTSRDISTAGYAAGGLLCSISRCSVSLCLNNNAGRAVFLGGSTFLLTSFVSAKNGERTRCASKIMKHRLSYVI